MNRIIKSLALTCLMAMGAQQMAAQELLETYELGFNGAELEQLWKSDVVLDNPSNGIQGYGANDQFIIHCNIEGKLKYHDRNGWTGEEVETKARSGKGISYDDAGNWIFRPMNQQNKLQRTKPVLVLLSLCFTPMSIVFTPFELVALVASVLIANRVASDGESNWLEGLQLVVVYIMIGAAFFFV